MSGNAPLHVRDPKACEAMMAAAEDARTISALLAPHFHLFDALNGTGTKPTDLERMQTLTEFYYSACKVSAEIAERISNRMNEVL